MKELAVVITDLDEDQEVEVEDGEITIRNRSGKKGRGLRKPKSSHLLEKESRVPKILEVKWEPEVEIFPLSMVPANKRVVMYSLFENSLNKNEVMGLINSSTLDNVMLVAFAYASYASKPEIIGCAVFNAWKGQLESQGALLVFLQASWRTQGVGRVLAGRLLDEAKTLFYTDTIVDGMKVNVCQRQPFVAKEVKRHGFTPVNLFR
jgi:GNAT superfamily N-acetyltransferase